MDDHDKRRNRRRREGSGWNPDPVVDYPVGPDDAGNVVMHGIGIFVTAWRRITAKLGKRP